MVVDNPVHPPAGADRIRLRVLGTGAVAVVPADYWCVRRGSGDLADERTALRLLENDGADSS